MFSYLHLHNFQLKYQIIFQLNMFNILKDFSYKFNNLKPGKEYKFLWQLHHIIHQGRSNGNFSYKFKNKIFK
jgi:hypothetical protein